MVFRLLLFGLVAAFVIAVSILAVFAYVMEKKRNKLKIDMAKHEANANVDNAETDATIDEINKEAEDKIKNIKKDIKKIELKKDKKK